MKLLQDLRLQVRGRVLLPTDDDFEKLCRPWNLAVRQPAAAVVEVADAADVAAVVRHARDAGLRVTAQPSGHGATGDTEGTILLRTRHLDGIHIDPVARRARVGAGVSWGAVQAQAARYGLTGLPGSSPVVSVTGYTLGGGLSWFGRAHGWAADSVTAFDVVDAEGTQAHVTATTDPDLFWALRGGGGDHALVTAIEFDLHPAPRLYGGRLLWPVRQAPEVFDAFRRITADAPDELTVWVELFDIPNTEPTVAVDVTHLGPAARARALLAPFDHIDGLISDSRGILPVTELGTITAEPTAPGPGCSRGELLTDLDDVTVAALTAKPIAPLLSVQLRHLGGALTRPSDSPHGALTEPYALYLFGIPGADPERSSRDANPYDTTVLRARQQELVDALAPHVADRKPYTYLAPGDHAENAFRPRELARLQDIKRRRDPRGVIRSNHPIPL